MVPSDALTTKSLYRPVVVVPAPYFGTIVQVVVAVAPIEVKVQETVVTVVGLAAQTLKFGRTQNTQETDCRRCWGRLRERQHRRTGMNPNTKRDESHSDKSKMGKQTPER